MTGRDRSNQPSAAQARRRAGSLSPDETRLVLDAIADPAPPNEALKALYLRGKLNTLGPDSGASLDLCLAVMRERAVRMGVAEPANERERQQAREGPCDSDAELDAVRESGRHA